ncbi:hypothetical protein [Dongia sp.]|uniref:hypothetical protein n=1 Tax=Dongia sp. TaxID=1977262 RepID=UPI0035AEAD02
MNEAATFGDLPVASTDLDRALRRSKRIERAAVSEIEAFANLQSQQSPWEAARRIRLQALLDEIGTNLQVLDRHRRDLSLRLRLHASAARAAQAYAQARHHLAHNMKG